MAYVKITQGGITTEVSKGELDWYKRNGWKVVEETPTPEPTPEPEAEPEDQPEKKSKKK